MEAGRVENPLMELSFERIAVVGATGATGQSLVEHLLERGARVRVVSRRLDALARLFPDPRVEKRGGDALDRQALRSAVDGCDLLVDCVGLPADAMADHPRVARTLADVARQTGARCLQISSYWSYIPITRLPLTESHPRSGGPPWIRYRREAENTLRDAGAAIVQLPDFFGPRVSFSTLQGPLKDAVAGRPMNWIGAADCLRDYIFVPDAMGIVGELLGRRAAYGERWLIPGSGPISAREVAGIVSEILGRTVRIRAAGPLMLRLVSLFNRELRGFMQLVPTYVQPIRYDGARLDALLGPTQRTAYPAAIRATLGALQPPGAGQTPAA